MPGQKNTFGIIVALLIGALIGALITYFAVAGGTGELQGRFTTRQLQPIRTTTQPIPGKTALQIQELQRGDGIKLLQNLGAKASMDLKSEMLGYVFADGKAALGPEVTNELLGVFVDSYCSYCEKWRQIMSLETADNRIKAQFYDFVLGGGKSVLDATQMNSLMNGFTNDLLKGDNLLIQQELKTQFRLAQ